MQCPDQPGKGPRVGFPAHSGRKKTFTDGSDVGHFMQDPTRISLTAHSHFTDAQREAQRQDVVTQRVEGKTGSRLQADGRCPCYKELPGTQREGDPTGEWGCGVSKPTLLSVSGYSLSLAPGCVSLHPTL